MAKINYIQDNLPNFDKACAEAEQKGLDKTAALSRQYIHFAKMEQKCHNPKALEIIQLQKKRLIQGLATPPKKQEQEDINAFRHKIHYLIEHNVSAWIET